MMILKNFFRKLVRRKYVDLANVTETKLSRCLSTLDLTALGIGSTLGAGIYVVAGQVALQTAGPSVVISFLIAALASVLAGLCYAEFGARVPKTGSAYVYSYVTVGELIAFVIGWNLILEYVIGTASVARAWSAYFDSMINNTIQNFFQDHVSMDVPGLSAYPDFFALAITILLSGILAIGVKESSTFNKIFTCVNLLVVSFVVICGAFKADGHNWSIPVSEIPNGTTGGDGGFMPFGFSGMMSGAATCFYAFVGFDCIATTGEEVKNPQKAIPISIVVALLVCFVAYFGVSAILTLMCPYYLLDSEAPLPAVFDRVGWGVARYIISVGAICGLSTSLLGAMFPLPRVIYAMATDGLLFRFLSNINDRFRTPLIATILSGVLSGVMAMLFDIKELVDMMSIGTLLAYTLVALCVLILRYKISPIEDGRSGESISESEEKLLESSSAWSQNSTSDTFPLQIDKNKSSVRSIVAAMFVHQHSGPSVLSEKVASWEIWIMCLLITALCVVLVFGEAGLANGEAWAILLVVLIGILILTCLFSIWRQPQNKTFVSFKVPFLPVLPAVSVFVNVYLMLKLSTATWIRFAVWMAIGFLIYFSYGIWQSSQGQYAQHIPLQNLASDEEEDRENEEELPSGGRPTYKQNQNVQS